MRPQPIGPGRTGRQSASWSKLRLAAGFAVAWVLLGTIVGFGLPLVAFFAVGAGAGYSLSGSV